VSIVGRGDGYEYEIHSVFFGKADNVLVTAFDAHTADRATDLAFVVVNSDNGQDVTALGGGDLVEQQGASGTAAYDHSTSAIGRALGSQHGPECAVEKTNAYSAYSDCKHIKQEESKNGSKREIEQCNDEVKKESRNNGGNVANKIFTRLSIAPKVFIKTESCEYSKVCRYCYCNQRPKSHTVSERVHIRTENKIACRKKHEYNSTVQSQGKNYSYMIVPKSGYRFKHFILLLRD
jgi:hypothetical protein